MLGWRAREDRAEAPGRLEQLRGLAPDHLEIRFVEMSALCILSNCSTSPSAMVLVASASTSHHSHVVDAHHHLESAGVEKIADQHARRVAERRVRRLAPAAQGGLVHDIVMQQRRGMDELDHRGELHGARRPDSRKHARPAAPAPGAGACRHSPMMYSATWRISATSESSRARMRASTAAMSSAMRLRS